MTLDENILKELIECFVSIYGEKHRKIITEKINNCLILLCGYKSKEQIEKIKEELNKKYMEILSNKVRKIIDLSNDEITFLFGNSIFESKDLIGVFNSSSQKIIDSDKKTRTALFNTKIILETRENFSKISSKSISTTIADNLIEIYDEIVKQAKTELFTSTINFEENKAKLEKYDFLETPIFGLESYDFENQQHNGVQPNFIRDEDGNVKLYPIINFSIVKNSMAAMFGAPDYFDVLLIHEINHIIGMHLLEYTDKGKYKVQMGLVESDAGNNKTDYFFMDYIDEVFNQYIAKKVTNLLHNKGIYLLDNPKSSQTNDSSLYEMGEFLLEDFFSTFYNDLLEQYAEGRNLHKFYSQIDINELRFLGSLIQEYLKRDDILDISDSENMEYAKKAKEIMTRIKQNSKKEQLYEVVQLLDLNELESITPEKIKLAYDAMLKKLNIINNDSKIAEKANAVLLDALNYALSNIGLIKNTEGISTNMDNAKMYQMQKSDILNNLNRKNPLILYTLITELEKSGLSISKIIKCLNSLEYGLLYPNVVTKLIELFGEETYDLLINYTETNQSDYEKLSLLTEQLEDYIIFSRSNSTGNNLK